MWPTLGKPTRGCGLRIGLPTFRIKENIQAIGCGRLAAPMMLSRAVSAKPQHRKLLGAAIREYRKRTGLTQEKLAERADLHPNYVGEVERGEKTISVDALLRIATAMRVGLCDLVREIDRVRKLP